MDAARPEKKAATGQETGAERIEAAEDEERTAPEELRGTIRSGVWMTFTLALNPFCADESFLQENAPSSIAEAFAKRRSILSSAIPATFQEIVSPPSDVFRLLTCASPPSDEFAAGWQATGCCLAAISDCSFSLTLWTPSNVEVEAAATNSLKMMLAESASLIMASLKMNQEGPDHTRRYQKVILSLS